MALKLLNELNKNEGIQLQSEALGSCKKLIEMLFLGDGIELQTIKCHRPDFDFDKLHNFFWNL